MFPPRLTAIAHRGRVELNEPDVLELVPPTEDILHLNRVWKIHEHTSPLVMLELWRPTDEFDEFMRQCFWTSGVGCWQQRDGGLEAVLRAARGFDDKAAD